MSEQKFEENDKISGPTYPQRNKPYNGKNSNAKKKSNNIFILNGMSLKQKCRNIRSIHCLIFFCGTFFAFCHLFKASIVGLTHCIEFIGCRRNFFLFVIFRVPLVGFILLLNQCAVCTTQFPQNSRNYSNHFRLQNWFIILLVKYRHLSPHPLFLFLTLAAMWIEIVLMQ